MLTVANVCKCSAVDFADVLVYVAALRASTDSPQQKHQQNVREHTHTQTSARIEFRDARSPPFLGQVKPVC